MEQEPCQILVAEALINLEEIENSLQPLVQNCTLLKIQRVLEAIRQFKNEVISLGLIEIHNLGDRLERLVLLIWQNQVVVDSTILKLFWQVFQHLRLIFFELQIEEYNPTIALSKSQSILQELESKICFDFLANNNHQHQQPQQYKTDIVGELMLFLEPIASRPHILIKELLSWTDGQPLLTEDLCQLICQQQIQISDGEEATLIQNLIFSQLLSQPTQAISKHFQIINNALSQSKEKAKLLRLYQQILQGETTIDDITWQQKLLNLGLLTQEKDTVKVANLIYKIVFNGIWVKQELAQNFSLNQLRIPHSLGANKTKKFDNLYPLTLAIAVVLSSLITSIGIQHLCQQLPNCEADRQSCFKYK
jgi:hypothetical protein